MLTCPFTELWNNSQKMEVFKIKYFHRHISFNNEYDYNYRKRKYLVRWRFSFWLGYRVFHLVLFMFYPDIRKMR